MSSSARAFGWRSLLVAAAGADFALLLATALALRDREALIVAAVAAAGLGLLRRRRGRAGTILLALLFADLLFWSVPGAVSNIVHREQLLDYLIPASHSALALAGFVAGIALLIRRLDPEAGVRVAGAVGLAAIATVAVILGAAALAPEERDTAAEGDLLVETKNTAFSATRLVADAGEVAVRMGNEDFFWHTFTIDRLGVDLQVPVGGERRVAFRAPPGEYRYYCRIPGHSFVMKGTLVVRAS